MPTILIGIAALLIILWFMHKFVQADPKGMAKVMQRAGGVVAIVAAVFLATKGAIVVAIPLAFFGLGLLGWVPLTGWGFGFGSQKSPGQVSRVRSAFVEMELDHDTGRMRGNIISGKYAGASLDSLELTSLVSLLTEIDDESRALLMAYLDRRDARWREHAQAGGDFRERAAPRTGKMTEEEAYQILGLQPGASAKDIGHAHRALMKKLHPDQGGSTYLAARINEAKEVLLRRHR